ncbi:MDR family MFS transporter [Streptomyces sp. WAC06614]|uniref:MDR family MFS transporter n=1 Tax=Streptomyces sp. WAC06614 TaxID=2487416 RepID=UPI000F795108|nr:MDR family MFS transporter [Streptomyces sp. WAC06614]RSS81173.1 MFS transporter [Streptomyces sp. WAC06614]
MAPSPAGRVRLGTQGRLVLGALVLITFVGSMDSTVLATALPTIARELGDLQHLSWVVTSYLLAVTSSALIWGKLGDLWGHKAVLQTALVLFLVGSVLCSQAQDLPELICFRAVQGLGGGGMWVVPQAVLTGLVGARDRGRYQVYIAGAAATASVLGPFLGGLLVERGSWRWVFYLNLPVGLLVMGVLAFCLRGERPGQRPRVDYWGSVLIAACASGIALLVTWGGVVFAWFSPPMLLLLAVVLVLLVLIRQVERSHPEPLLPARVVRERVFRIVVPLSFFFWVVQSGTINYLPLFFQVVKGTSPTVSGMMLLPMSLSGLLAYVLSGHAIARSGRYRHFPVIGAVLMLVGLGVAVALPADASFLAYGAALVVLGLGFGLVSQIALIAAQSACAYRDMGVVTSGVIFFRNLGSVFGAALFGAVLNKRLVDHLAAGMHAGRFTAEESRRIHKGQPLSVESLSPTARQTYVGGYEAAVDEVLLAGLAVSLLVLALACVLPAVPLRGTMTATGVRKDSTVIPSLPAGDDHVRRALEDLSRAGLLPVRRRAEEHARRHGVSLAEIWLLCLVSYGGTTDPAYVGEVMDVPPRVLRARLRSLWATELLYAGDRPSGPTPRGVDLVADLSAVLREQLSGPLPHESVPGGRPGPPDLRGYVVEILAEGSVFRPWRETD